MPLKFDSPIFLSVEKPSMFYNSYTRIPSNRIHISVQTLAGNISSGTALLPNSCCYFTYTCCCLPGLLLYFILFIRRLGGSQGVFCGIIWDSIMWDFQNPLRRICCLVWFPFQGYTFTSKMSLFIIFCILFTSKYLLLFTN